MLRPELVTMPNSRTKNNKPQSKKAIKITLFAVYGLLCCLILGESFVPGDASFRQSWSLSSFFASFINDVSPSKEAIEYKPTAISAKTSHPILKEDQAVAGTTKMFSYSLSYEEGANGIYASSVSVSCLKSPSPNCYTSSLSSTDKGGVFRVSPLEKGEYAFSLKDASGHEDVVSFLAEERLSPSSLSFEEGDIEAELGKAIPSNYRFAIAGIEGSENESADHYLQRFFSSQSLGLSSSDPSIFEVNSFGDILPKGVGTAQLLFKGEKVKEVHVSPSLASAPKVASITLKADNEMGLSPLDFDFQKQGYGVNLTPHYFDAERKEITFAKGEEPLIDYSTSDYLKGIVSNAHLEDKRGDPSIAAPVKEGHVYGYRNPGKVTINASLAINPEIKVSIELFSSTKEVSEVNFVAKAGGSELKENDVNDISAGTSITFASSSFYPENANNKSIHIEVSDPNVLKILNNDTTYPSINVAKEGDASFSVSSLSLGERSKKTYQVHALPLPRIAEQDMGDFHMIVRKGIGHFSLFAATSLFGFLAFYFGSFEEKRFHLLIASGVSLLCGVALALISELIQLLPALKRGSSFIDVGIDSAGYLAMTLLMLGIFYVIALFKRRKTKGKEE